MKGSRKMLVALAVITLGLTGCTQEAQNKIGRSIQNWTGTDGVLEVYAGEKLVKRFLKIDKLYILPIVIFIQMGYHDSGQLVEINILFTVAFLVASILDTVIQKKPKKLGKLTIPLAILCGLSLLTWINSPSFYIMIAGFFNIFIVLAAYLYAVNTFEERNDNMIYISKIFVYSSMLVTAQMIYFIYQSDFEIMYIIQRRITLTSML